MLELKRDPRIRKDGKCRCGKVRPKAAVRDGDPWCSNLCCRKYHGFPLLYGIGKDESDDLTVTKRRQSRSRTGS